MTQHFISPETAATLGQGAGNFKPNDRLYIPSGVQQSFINGWYGTIAEQMASITNLHDILLEKGVSYGFDAPVLAQFNAIYDLLAPAYVKYCKKIATPKELAAFKRYLEEMLEYVRDAVKLVAKGRYGAGVIDIVDLNTLGFLSDRQGKGSKPLPIPTEIPTAKFSQKGEPDKGFVIIERNINIDAEQGGGGAWAKNARGAIIAIKEATEPESAYRYQFVSKIHNHIDIPKEWRGKKMHLKVAYVAHANDPINKLHWSQTQTVFLLGSVED